jgi:hypothetical protein
MPDSHHQRVQLYPEKSSIAADRLDGAAEIAEFLFGENTVENRKKVYRLAAQKQAPIVKHAGKLLSSRKRLTAHYEDLFPKQAAE